MATFLAVSELLGGAVLAVCPAFLPGYEHQVSVLVPAEGAEATVFVRGADQTLASPVSVFANDDGSGGELPQPLRADVDGRFPGFVSQPAALDIALGGVGVSVRTVSVGLPLDSLYAPVSETARAVAAEAANAAAIATEATRASSAERANVLAISSEVGRAQDAEALIVSALTTETARARSAEQANAAGISAEMARAQAAEGLLAPLDSPAFTGSPSGPTAPAADGSTRFATTAYADRAAADAGGGGGGIPPVLGDIDWGDHKITTLGDATTDADALNRRTADGRYDAAGAAAAAQAASAALALVLGG